MQRQPLQRLFLTGLLLLLLANPLAAQTATKGTALVIGNGKYQVLPLACPPNDAQDMANTLKNMGFAVTLVLDADQATIEKSVNDFGTKLRNGGTGLFYYSGHGVQHAGGNYLIPIDSLASIASPEQLRYKAVNVGYVIGAMKEAGNALNIVILDACRNSPFKGFVRNVERGLVREQGAEGMLIAYATSPGKVAMDGSGRNSPYTKHLLQQMTVANVPIEIMFKRVRSAVVDETKGEQTPWYESSIAGDFSFVRTYGGLVTSAPVVEMEKPRPSVEPQIEPLRLSEAERSVEAEKLKRQIAAREVVEIIAGVGFKGLPLGSTPEQVEEVFGKPDEINRYESGGTSYVYRPDAPIVKSLGRAWDSHSFTFREGRTLNGIIIADNSGVSPGFPFIPLRTAKGITFGDSREDVIQKYGTPTKSSDVNEYGVSSLYFGEQGISFVFSAHKASNISIFPPKAE